MTWATLTPDGEFAEHEGVPTLEQMQEVVAIGAAPGSHWVEVVELRHEIQMWLNEEGKYAGEDGGPLPKNSPATFAAQEYPKLGPGDFIAGHVVFTGVDQETGETADLTEEQLDYVRQLGRISEIGRVGSGVWNFTGIQL